MNQKKKKIKRFLGVPIIRVFGETGSKLAMNWPEHKFLFVSIETENRHACLVIGIDEARELRDWLDETIKENE